MYILVQSFLNTATNVNLSVNSSDTISSVKIKMFTAEGVSAGIMDLYYNGTIMANANTLSSYGITSNNTYIRSHNNIARLPSREDRQKAKLALAAVDRAADSKRSTLTIGELPTQWAGNTLVDNANIGGLVEGRPWN